MGGLAVSGVSALSLRRQRGITQSTPDPAPSQRRKRLLDRLDESQHAEKLLVIHHDSPYFQAQFAVAAARLPAKPAKHPPSSRGAFDSLILLVGSDTLAARRTQRCAALLSGGASW